MKNNSKNTDFVNPSEEELDKWTTEFGELTCLEVDGMEFWFKEPSRIHIEAANSFLFEKNIAGYNDCIIDNTLLNGEVYLDQHPKVRYALHKQVEQIVTDKVAKVKKRLTKPK